jgi:hypothetical protein
MLRKRENLKTVFDLRLINKKLPDEMIKNPVVLITGDGNTLAADVKEFEAWGIEHDLFCVNRSLLYFERPVNHWAAIDAQESIWFAEHYNKRYSGNGNRLLRHTIGICPVGYDMFWEVAQPFDNSNQRWIWIGNSGYFAVLAALQMGYQKVVLAGAPLNRENHWYEPKATDGPSWVGDCYTQWMDFKMQKQEAARVKSLSGYSAFILGQATKDWLNG